MIRFEGDRSFALPADAVAARLSDASFLVGCLNNVEEVVKATANRAVWKLRTGISLSRLSSKLRVTVAEPHLPEIERLTRQSAAALAPTSVVRAELRFIPIDVGTTVHYTAEVAERTGVLKIVSAGLIQAAAKNVMSKTPGRRSKLGWPKRRRHNRSAF